MFRQQADRYRPVCFSAVVSFIDAFLVCSCPVIANEAADPRGSAVELANHRAVREYRRKISSQRKGLFLTIFGCK